MNSSLRGYLEPQFGEYRKVQKNRCAICDVKEGAKLHLDHDHATGQPRGLLCRNCNLGLGLFKDDQRRLAQAIRYLAHPTEAELRPNPHLYRFTKNGITYRCGTTPPRPTTPTPSP